MMLSILQAIWQADGTFPSGSFAFSYGVEGVVARRSQLDGTALAELTTTIIRQRDPVTRRPALANDRGRQFGKRGPIQLRAPSDNALDTIRESERSARKRSISLPDRLQDR